jgi:hypothetical protein
MTDRETLGETMVFRLGAIFSRLKIAGDDEMVKVAP